MQSVFFTHWSLAALKPKSEIQQLDEVANLLGLKVLGMSRVLLALKVAATEKLFFSFMMLEGMVIASIRHFQLR